MIKVHDKKFFSTLKCYLDIELPNKGSKSKDTEKAYRDGIDQFLDYLGEVEGVPLNKVGFANLSRKAMEGFRRCLEARSLAPSTVRNRMAAVRSFIAYAAKVDAMDSLSAMDALSADLPKAGTRLVVPLGDEALKALLAQPDPSTRTGYRDRCILAFMYDTAARRQEVAAVRVCDLRIGDGEGCVYLRGKGGKTRVVPLELSLDHVVKYLAAFHPGEVRGSEAPLFYPQGGAGRAMTTSNVEKLVKKYAAAARKVCSDVPESVHPHLLRHTRAMNWRKSGMPLFAIAELLGHENLSTSRIYAKSDVSMKRRDMELYRSGQPPIGDTDEFWLEDEETIRKLYGLK